MTHLPQNAAPEVHATELDDIGDWVKRLKQARETVKMAQEIERECKGVIEAKLAENEAEYGTVNGRIVIQAQEITRRSAPSVAIMEKVAPDILEQWGKTTTFVTLKFVEEV